MFRQDNELFTNIGQVINGNNQYHPASNLFSRLHRLENGGYRNADGYLEFKVVYPELSGYNQWRQKSNPTTSGKKAGYKPVNLPWPNSFDGLAI